MKKFLGKVDRLSNILSKYEIEDQDKYSEGIFNLAIKNHEWIYLVDENQKPLGYFNQFWIEEVDGVKYVFGSGFIFDDVDFNKVPALKNFQLVENVINSEMVLDTGENAENCTCE